MPLTVTFARSRWSATWLMSALTLITVIAFVDLGRWQWHRAQQKTALLTSFEAGGQTLLDVSSADLTQLPRFVAVRVVGRYDTEHQFLLDNLSHNAQPGYQVLTPLRLSDGRVLMVNRGWVPFTGSRSHLPDVHLDADADLSVQGRLDDLPVVGIALGHVPPAAASAWPQVTSFPTMADLSAALQLPLAPRQLLLGPDESHGYVRDWHPSGFGPGRHISYALQWWSFAGLALALYAIMNWKRTSR